MSDANGVKLRRSVMLRLGSYALCVALLTGLALFFHAGIRDAGSWGWFTLGAMAAAAGLVSLGHFAQSASVELVKQGVGDTSVVQGKDSEPITPPDVMHGAKAAPDEEEVDYLMALRHEFRTPLNAVLGFSDVLLSGIDGEVNESQHEDLEIIRASGIRLKLLLDSALDLSQLAGGQLRMNIERTDVRELLARVAAEARQLWSNKRSAKCALPEEPCVTQVDQGRLCRSILVLADFLATDHRDAEIVLGLASSGGRLAIEVTAIGSDRLSFDALPNTSEVLASEDASEIRRWPVAVTAEIISQHDGSLYHGNAPSRFLVRLPLQGAR